MTKLIKILSMAVIVVGCFYLAGRIALLSEGLHNSWLLSTSVFGVSFLSMINGPIRAFTDIFVHSS